METEVAPNKDVQYYERHGLKHLPLTKMSKMSLEGTGSR